ncbi:helix-turn-helix domain-containing protein [Tardiphaga sp.]|jgi:transcriptional regulator with XRE-family HTH domain|uniref:helix-turn-helix domain-containing protein n=1 Tax=Tardiphaga sp. TaxID=1926292 RepID=UPI0037D9AE61
MKQRSAGQHDSEIGTRIRARRNMQKISQAELGEALGVSFQQIQKYEKGVNRVGAARLAEIAKALGTSTSALLGGDATEAANPEALTMMATNDGAKLARAFNEIVDPNHRQAVLSLARTLAETAAVGAVQFQQAAE